MRLSADSVLAGGVSATCHVALLSRPSLSVAPLTARTLDTAVPAGRPRLAAVRPSTAVLNLGEAMAVSPAFWFGWLMAVLSSVLARGVSLVACIDSDFASVPIVSCTALLSLPSGGAV